MEPVVEAFYGPGEKAKEQKAWYWYDWANSAYVTTVATVLFAPYLISVAENAACPGVSGSCDNNLSVLGVSVAPGALVSFVFTAATIVSALVLPIVGAGADRSSRKPTLMARYAWAGSTAAALMFFVTGSNWQLGALLLFAANICLGASLVVYDAILVDISDPDERDRVSSLGWARGYLGGGLLLAINLAMVLGHDQIGVGKGMMVRLSLLSAAIWWAAFTVIPYRRIRGRAPRAKEVAEGGLILASFGQLWATLKDLRNYPMTLTFLAAYLFFNDGIQTVIVEASTYGEAESGLQFAEEVLIATILLVQFVAFGGALVFGRLAGKYGAKRTILAGLGVWILVVAVGYVLPAKNLPLFLMLAITIGIILGGTQALSRSLFSHLIPHGREAEYFSLYQACERGTSWTGTLVFGVVFQITHSYRPALFALAIFFVVGGILLSRVDMKRGVAEAGNQAPAIL